MKKMKLFSGVVIVLALTVAILLNNRTKMQARSKPDVVRFLPVTVAQVTKERLSESVSLVGTITANSDVAIVSETQGKVIRVLASIGDYVKAGATIVEVDDELKKAAYATTEVNYEKAKKDLERYESLIKDSSVSDTQLEGARLAFKSAEAQYIVARRQFNDTKIKTPIAGVVSARQVDVGTMIQTNNTIANVVDISMLKVRLNVSEQDAFRIKAGDKVEVATDVYPGITFEGKVSSISSKADDAHTYPVEVVLANSARHPLKAGMFGRVSLVSVKDHESVTIPRQALVGSTKKPQVYVVDNGIARLRNIVVGAQVGTNLEVLNGIMESETIVMSGQNNLKDSVAVTVLK
ncbi:MAG: efflux RND transporter periplasmic adaptor subunit [Ignavibacteriales bacterium]|nr:efflux RND transporter periplasmic adaptor subunit [Ignavibacteriales bacterium]